MDLKITKTKGGISKSSTGIIRFANDFNPGNYKRFYQITLPKKNLVRAFHGHMVESKAVFPISGSVMLCVVKLSNPKNPSKNTKVKKYLLSANSPTAITIPPGNANGIMSLQSNSSVIFFSDKTLEQSQKDDYRFEPNYWGKDIWENE